MPGRKQKIKDKGYSENVSRGSGKDQDSRAGGGIGNIRGWAEESIWLFQVPGAVEESSGASSTSFCLSLLKTGYWWFKEAGKLR